MLVLSETASNKPKSFMWFAALISVLFILAVAGPTLFPKEVPFLHSLKIDTDPENMLASEEPVRVFHNERKKEYNLYDIIVVGVVNKTNPHGVFNARSLKNIYELGEYAREITWDGDEGRQGVIETEIISPSNVDNIEQAGLGTVRFEWLMSAPPESDEAAQAVGAKAMNLPFLKDTLVSGDGQAIALYIPITSKNISYKVAGQLRDKIASFDDTGDEYHITGLPIAQDTFGIEMFIQMAISAPMAMVLIFLLMWYFFRSVKLIVAPMVVAMVSVIVTMGALVATGNTVHIMSSMIPVFIMPIAVLDAVHILSDFFDVYPKFKDRKKTLSHVMHELSKPMFFTSLTTAAGFGSLAFTPIPPVQVFGIFIAFGVVMAWLFTITLVPAYIMLMKEESLEGFGMAHHEEEHPSTPLARLLIDTGRFTYSYAKLVLLVVLVLFGISAYGISKIQINDNPVKWFSASHPIRVADKELNERFAGTYMAYLELRPQADTNAAFVGALDEALAGQGPEAEFLKSKLGNLGGDLNAVKDFLYAQQDAATDDETYYAWDDVSSIVDETYGRFEIFKQPDVLRYVQSLQEYLLKTGLVGKSNALPDIIKTVHRELFLGEGDAYRIPDTQNAVAQTLITYQNSHRPNDLWHFTTPAYDKTVLWIQLKSGDNKDMNKVIAAVNQFAAENPPPVALDHQWFGLTYINTVWQDKMVSGMMEAFLGSFAIVLVMMIVLFRSLLWGILSMVPLTVTIAFIYGIIGLIGKDYDMPVAVLSSLSLGLAVDYSIHFLARSREAAKKCGAWKDTIKVVFGEPARAIARNVIVIGMGFTPLLFAPLVPYKTVGFFISAILFFAGVATLLILPALITVMEGWLFKKKSEA